MFGMIKFLRISAIVNSGRVVADKLWVNGTDRPPAVAPCRPEQVGAAGGRVVADKRWVDGTDRAPRCRPEQVGAAVGRASRTRGG